MNKSEEPHPGGTMCGTQRRADSESKSPGGPSELNMYYIGLDLHKQTISYCVKEANGRIVAEGSILATRAALDSFIDQLPKPWSAAMEAILFAGWVSDH